MYFNFEKIMERAKREYDRNPDVRRYILANIEFAKKYKLDYIKNNPAENAEELKQGIFKIIEEDSQEFARISNIKNVVFDYEIIELLIKNPKELDRLYNKVKDEEEIPRNEHYINKPFELRKEDYIRSFIKSIKKLREDRKEEIELSIKYLSGDKIAREVINQKKKHMSPKKQEELETNIRLMCKKDLDMIRTLLPECKTDTGNSLKQSYIEILTFIGRFLKKYGLTSRYVSLNNQKLIANGLSGLCISQEEFESNSILNGEHLNGLKLDELPVMTAFWLNRYTKEIRGLNDGIFAINALNLWQDILEGKTDFEITEEQLKAIFCKTEFLRTVNDEIGKSVTQKLNNNTASIIDKKDDVAQIDVQEELDEIEEKVRVDYYNEFQNKLPNSYAQILDDLSTYIPLTSNLINAYAHKDEIIITQVLAYMRNKRIRNWGYIFEKKPKDKGLVLIGIDYEGYNMPVKVHIQKEKLIEGLKEAGLEPIIPIYEGHEDMIINNELLKSHIIINLTDKQRNKIKEYLVQGNNTKQVMNFLEHLNFLRDFNKYPKHLMIETTEKGKKILVRPPRKYINIETNERFTKDKNGVLKQDATNGDQDGR